MGANETDTFETDTFVRTKVITCLGRKEDKVLKVFIEYKGTLDGGTQDSFDNGCYVRLRT